MTFERKTVAHSIQIEGLGLHSGVPVSVQLHPAEAGIWFRLGGDRIQAVPENVSDTTRCTRLGVISTVEHLMSAFAGLGVTDAEAELSASELPGLDGSAVVYVERIAATGLVAIGSGERKDLFSRIFHQDTTDRKIAIASGQGWWRYTYDLGKRWPGEQMFEAEVCDYVQAIAPARTIVLSEEIEAAKAAGLGKGLDDSSVLIIGESGYANPYRFPDEPARHKLLDLIGDLYLSGVPPQFLDVVAERTGHRSNVATAQMLYEATKLD